MLNIPNFRKFPQKNSKFSKTSKTCFHLQPVTHPLCFLSFSRARNCTKHPRTCAWGDNKGWKAVCAFYWHALSGEKSCSAVWMSVCKGKIVVSDGNYHRTNYFRQHGIHWIGQSTRNRERESLQSFLFPVYMLFFCVLHAIIQQSLKAQLSQLLIWY